MGSIFKIAMNVLASFLWSTGTAIARRFSKSRKKLPARVISLGNIQVGGAGKTPLVAYLARQAHERGLKACILCRGYHSPWETQGGVISPGDLVDARQCGDEAALLHDLAPQAWIGVGADRARQFEEVLKSTSIDLVILDDGFQNHRLYKDLDIVALTSASWGEKVFRDFRSAMRSANLLVWTKGEKRPNNLGRPMVRVQMELDPASSSDAKSHRFLLVTGLADGNEARKTIERAGYRIDKHLIFPDHARYVPEMAQSIVEQARAQGLKIAITGKDWVKWREMIPSDLKNSMIWVLEPSVRLDLGDEKIWNQVIWGS